MGVSSLSISVFCTVLSFVNLLFWTELSFEKLKSSGLIGDYSIRLENAGRVWELISGSFATIALVANFALNLFILLILCLKTIFFAKLDSSEIQKLVECLINYVVYKGTFLPLVVPPTIFLGGLWSTWLAILCSLKMFQALARDRLDRLNASPSATPWTYSRVYCVLLLVLSVDVLWISFCLSIHKSVSPNMVLLLFFEPLSIAFETQQAIVVHGFQLLDIWLHHPAGNSANCRLSKLFDFSAAGLLWEWKGILIRNLGFLLDMMTLLMALGHHVHIWWLHGMAFHLVDAVLFLNIRALSSAIVKRMKGFVKLRLALGALHGALPDATCEELQAYDDECAICRESMAKAKKLSCSHLFHLACLRSWLDQSSSENYACPICRKPLLVGRTEDNATSRSAEISSDEQLARQLSSRLDRQNSTGHTLPVGVFPNQAQNPSDGGDWRNAAIEANWLGINAAGPSTGVRSVGLGRVQMMMRQLAAVGETYAQTALEDAAWSLWPMNPPQAGSSSTQIAGAASLRYPVNGGGLHVRTTSLTANDNIANILAMAETVREVLPHIPNELIIQDLQRTNSVTVTVNNLLQV